MASELDNAIDLAPGLYIHKKLKKAKDEKHADAASLLKTLKWYRFGVFLLHLAVGILSLGIVPLIYFLGKRHYNKTQPPEKHEHTNFFTYAFYESKAAISAFEKLCKTSESELSEEASQQASQRSEEDQDTNNDSSDSAKENEEDEEDALYRFALKCNNPLGPRLGGRILKEDPLHFDHARHYEERTSATILKNGHILACDLNVYKKGSDDRAVGIFDHGKNLLTPLFRYTQSQIENGLIALEYSPKKFIYFYKRSGKYTLIFNDGRHEICLDTFNCHSIIPTYFEFTSTKFIVSSLALTSSDFEGKNNVVYSRSEHVASTNKNNRLTTKIVIDQIGRFLGKITHDVGFNNQPVYSPIHYKDDPTEISTFAYNPSISYLYVANVENKLYRIPVKQTDNHMIERNGDAQVAQLKNGETITKIAVSDNGNYVLVARKDNHFEIYQQDTDFQLILLTKTIIDPNTEGEILDVKFVNDAIIFAATKKTVVIDIDQLRNLEVIKTKPNSEKMPTKKELEALRKHHTPQQSNQLDFSNVKSQQQLGLHILNNGNIASCEKVTFENGNISYLLKVKFLKDGQYKAIDTYIYSPNPIVTQFVPFQKNDRLIYFVRDNEHLKVIDANGQTIATKHAPAKGNLIIPIDFDSTADPQIASAVEFCETGEARFHFFTCGVHNVFGIGADIQHTPRVIKAAAYNNTNQRLYCIDGEQLKFITIKNGENPNQVYHDTRDKSLINVTHMSVSQNGHYLATTKDDGTVALYHMEEFNQTSKGEIIFIADFKIKGALPMAIGFVDDDKDLLISTDKQSVRIYNFEEEFVKTNDFNLG